MQVTRRYWATVGLASLLAIAAIVLQQSLLLLGAAALGAWLLIQQFLFVLTLVRVQNQLTITQAVDRSRVLVDDPATVRLEAALTDPTHLLTRVHLTIDAVPPVAECSAPSQDRQLTLRATEPNAVTTLTARWPVAGHYQFDPPTVTASDQQGLFRAVFPATQSPQPTVTVQPQRPRTMHIGQGGEQTAAAFGDHKTGDFGLGLDPGEIREYMPGDTLRQIDWKATARSQSPHVQEFEEETDYRTALIVDHRASMATGIHETTKLAYARQLALGFLTAVQADRDAIGLYGVGDEGITTRQPPAANTETYTQLEIAIHDLAPTTTDAGAHADVATAETAPRAARQYANRLRTADSAFGTQLRPFFAAAQPYVERIAEQPLYKTVQSQLPRINGTVSAIIVTDDTHRAEVRETVQIARHHCQEVLVFLTPTVLFESDGLTALDDAYARYLEFEDFRRDLTQLDGVTAFEVAPGDRLEALLATSTRQPAVQP